MAASLKNLSVAIGVLLLVIVATDEMASVEADPCKHLSGSYQGVCKTDDDCRMECLGESKDNIGGACDNRGFLGFASQCWCFTNCGYAETETVAPTSAPIRP